MCPFSSFPLSLPLFLFLCFDTACTLQFKIISASESRNGSEHHHAVPLFDAPVYSITITVGMRDCSQHRAASVLSLIPGMLMVALALLLSQVAVGRGESFVINDDRFSHDRIHLALFGSPDGKIDFQRQGPQYKRNNATKADGTTYVCASIRYVSPSSPTPFLHALLRAARAEHEI